MSVGAVVACCALAVACTPEQSASAPSPKPASTTPTESQIERQMRLDYEAAEKAYRANMAEQDRLYQAGGADEGNLQHCEPPQRAHICGSRFKRCVDIKRSGWHATGTTEIVGVVAKWWLAGERSRTDQLRGQQRRAVLRRLRQGRDAFRQSRRYVQELTVVKRQRSVEGV